MGFFRAFALLPMLPYLALLGSAFGVRLVKALLPPDTGADTALDGFLDALEIVTDLVTKVSLVGFLNGLGFILK